MTQISLTTLMHNEAKFRLSISARLVCRTITATVAHYWFQVSFFGLVYSKHRRYEFKNLDVDLSLKIAISLAYIVDPDDMPP